MNTETIGNLTTIIKTISVMFAGYALAYFVSIGLNLPITQEQLSEVIMTVIFFLIAYIDAKYPNTFKFLGNDKPVTNYEETVMNDEYVYPEEE